MVFENLVSMLLTRILGTYVKNFDPKLLKVGLWAGDVNLKDLELRREALDALGAPINVVEGHIGRLTLKIPYTNLGGAPVVVHIEDVYLLAAPKEEAEVNEEEEEARKQKLKIEKLDNAELLKDAKQEGTSASPEDQQKNQSFISKLTDKIINNLQIHIKNIHVRYEDSISTPGHAFAIGVMLQEISAFSTTDGWEKTFIQDDSGPTHKLAKLGALAVYWNTDDDLMSSGREKVLPDAKDATHDEMMTRFKDMILEGDSSDGDQQFILKPVSGHAKVTIDKSGKSDVPHYQVKLIFDEIGVALDDAQYRDALMMVDSFHYFKRHQEYRKLKPKNVRPKDDPRAWFRFAGDAVLGKIHDRNYRWSWAYFKQRRDDRRRYIELFKKKKRASQTDPLTAEETKELKKLEWKLGGEDMSFWRTLARNQLRKENVSIKKTPTTKQTQGWVAWAWGSKPQETEEEESVTDLTDEQRKEFYDAIDFDEKEAVAESVDVPEDTVKLQVKASLNTGSFTLKRDPKANMVELLSLYFDGFRAEFLQRPTSFLADVSLGGLRINDGTTPNSLFTQIVRVKDAPSEPIPKIELDESADISDELVDPFFQFQFEKNPLNKESDLAIHGGLKPLEVIWNPHFIVGIVQFFKPPERHMDSIGALMESASATVESLRQQTRAGLEFALEEHKTIYANLELQAPLIIVPESMTEESTVCLILDAGHITVLSDLVPKEKFKEIEAKQRQAYTQEDMENLNNLMYDRFRVKLTSTQLLIGPSIDATKAQLTHRDSTQSMHIVEEIDMDFLLEISIIPKAPNPDIPKVKISGNLPVLHALLSDKKYKSLMRIIDVAIPNMDEEDEMPPQATESTKAIETPSRPRPQSSISTKSNKARDRAASSSFKFSTQEAVILQDSDVDDDDDAVFEDASPGTEKDKTKMEQKNVYMHFTIERLQGSLYKHDPEERKPDLLLVELVAEDFGLDMTIRPYDITIKPVLGSVVVDDYVENSSEEFKSILSSGDKQSGGNLISISIIKVKRNSPEFMTKYEGIELHIQVDITTINLVVTRTTLLTLLDFILTTFTNQEATPLPIDSSTGLDGTQEYDHSLDQTATSEDSGSIRIKIDLKAINLILNNDGIRLATLSLTQADVGIFVLGKTLRIAAKLGDLTLLDDINQGASADSNLRKLITIQGDDLADFRYETFDSENKETYPGHDSSISLRAGSIKVNFLEEPFRKIIEFLVKFGKMQAIFNAARLAAQEQASQIQNSGRFKFDINIKTPIVVFPRVMIEGRPKRDLMTAYLGEIYAENKFVPLDDSKGAPIATKLSAGIRNIRLTSEFQFADDVSEELELIDKVDLSFLMTFADHIPGTKRPDMEIEGSMTDFNLRITQAQLKFLLELSRSVPGAFAVDVEANEQKAVEEVPHSTREAAEAVSPERPKQPVKPVGTLANLGPELGVKAGIWAKLDLVFHVHTIGLELILAKDDEPVGNLSAASLSKFSLDDTKVKLRMMTDDSLESELLIQSFTIHDSRTKETNKFRNIMTSTNKEVQQFMASVTITGGDEPNLVAILAIDSPRVIFALDYIFAVESFISKGLEVDDPVIEEEEDESVMDSESDMESTAPNKQASRTVVSSRDPSSSSKPEKDTPMSVAFRVNVVDAQIILIANPLIASSEAIVLSTKQVLIAKQHALTLQVSQTGMYLCRMDKFENTRLRILDDFSLQLSMDSSNPDISSINIDIEPLVLRLSLRDMKLARQIVERASMLSDEKDNSEAPSASAQKTKQLAGTGGLQRRTASGKGASTMAKTKKSKPVNTTARQNDQNAGKPLYIKHEELTATLEGMRVVLIGDTHELPILDLCVNNFSANATDWSSSLRADTNINMFINVYNFSKSAWEPLIEPWQLGLQVSRDSECLAVELMSPKKMEVTLTSATLALAAKSVDFFNQNHDVLSKSRGVEAPYRIKNYTGFEIQVWADGATDDQTTNIKDGDEIPWSFEDWQKMREKLSAETNTNVIGVMLLEGSGFDRITNISVNREGRTLYNLRPKKDQITHRLLIDVELGIDNVKTIIIRSPLLVVNNTQIPIELGVFDNEEGHLLKIEKISPGESRPAPVGAAFLKSLLVRPGEGFGYTWSTEAIWWRDLLKRPTRTMTCSGENDKQSPPFYFQLSADYDKGDPVTSIYPYMTIRLSAPVELENLLPYDFKYRIYDKNTKKDWTNFLRKGGRSPVHVVELSHLLLLSIDMQDTVFKPSEFAIINSNNQENFHRESKLVCKDQDGLPLALNLKHTKIPNGGGAFRVTVFSPYVILNKTGLDINIRSKSLLQQAKTAAGQKISTDPADGMKRKVLPYMFAFGGDDHKNRALLRVGESSWSRPQSFDAIGSAADVVLPSSSKNTEIHIAIVITPGEGKYRETKIVTLAPRFILKNHMSEDISIREPGSSELFTLSPNALQPLHFLQKNAAKQLAMCFPGVNNQWSSPFNISDLGLTHIKIAKAGQRQKLIRVEILMENATLFLHIYLENQMSWPFSMQNESDTEFMFYQANPNVDDEDVEDRSGWRPIRYRLPPRSIMPYSWDYPAALQKEIVIGANGKERHVKLMEIGNLIPMKIPASRAPAGAQSPVQQKIIELNVTADGPKQTLILSNYRASKSLYKQRSRVESSTSVAAAGFEVKDQDVGVTFRASVKLADFGVSLVNLQLKEVAYITIRDIAFDYTDSAALMTITANIKWIQIDNQLYGGVFPIILYPTKLAKNSKGAEIPPSLHAQLRIVKDDSYGVTYIKYATVLLQEMTVEIDLDFIYALSDFYKPYAIDAEDDEAALISADSLDIPEPQHDKEANDFYFESLFIQSTQLNISFAYTDKVNTEGEPASNHNPIYFAAEVFTMTVGNITDAPVRFTALILENARMSSGVLVGRMFDHYKNQALFQMHKIVGSADFLGNPVGLFNSVSSGVADIFIEPYQGLIMSGDNPEMLGIGIAKGATSFVKKSVFGFSDSFSKFTGSVAKGLSQATMDKEFQARRRTTQNPRNRPKHALYGITEGANSLVSSVYSGVSGLAKQPLQGAEREGAAGFFKGVGKGLVGLATKPAIGIFDLASNVSEGIKNTTTVFDDDGLDRARLPRFIGADGIVRPYSDREALGAFWLRELDKGKYSNERYIAHLELPREDVVVMLSYARIMLIKSKNLSTAWDVPLKEITTISKERTGLSLILKGGQQGPFIPVSEESSRNFLYKKIGVAVNEFNKKFRQTE